MSLRVAFWDNQLCERGTTVALFDYAYYNQTILNNTSYIFYDRNNQENKNAVVEKFKKHFTVHGTRDFKETDRYLTKYGIKHIYIIKSGAKDDRISKVARSCIHCVFNCAQPHGDIYSSIAPWVRGNNNRYPVVPHMINLPDHDRNIRSKLNIPENATVFGGYGGTTSFNIKFVHKVVFEVARRHPRIYFLFANFSRFCSPLPNVIHLSTIVDLDRKVEFINSCDAMLWAQGLGEVMSMAMGEFSSKNKPIITMKIGFPGHVHLLGKKAIWYSNWRTLATILINFDKNTTKKGDWNAYKEYTPEKVMKIFERVYLR